MHKAKTQKGFIAIVALGIFAILAVFGIIVQMTILESSRNIKNADNFYVATDIADSILEQVQYELKSRGPGYTQASACRYDKDGKPIAIKFSDVARSGNKVDISTRTPNSENNTDKETSGNTGTKELLRLDEQFTANDEFCPDSLDSISANKDVKVAIYVKGRNLDSEALKVASCPGKSMTNSNCYIVPSPGTGTAGQRCDFYKPTYISDQESITGSINPLDNTCNWNKLTFGSSATDRVAIPLFYEDENGTVIDPFVTKQSQNFILRLRTPCLPCVYAPENAVNGESRTCLPSQDPTICDWNNPNEVYQFDLSGEKDDIVAQWQMHGLCDGKECGIEGYAKSDFSTTNVGSAISEVNIQKNKLANFIVLDSRDSNYQGLSTAGYSEILSISKFLEESKNTLFQIGLSYKLISENKKNIPYLEYQIITGAPISNYQTTASIIINVNGTIVKKDISTTNQSDLIDFAIQN